MCAARVIQGPWGEREPERDRPRDPPPDPPPEPRLQVQRVSRGPRPQRYRVGRHGPLVLMDCKECRTPFRSDEPVPHDLLCLTCRPLVGKLALFDVAGEPTTSEENR